MDRIYHPTSSGSPPAVDSHATPGFPANATIFTPWMAHQIIEELRGVVVAAGITPNKASTTQLLEALNQRYGSGGSLSGNGWQRLPGGLIIQWGNTVTNGSGQAVVTFPLTFPASLFRAIINPISGNHTVGLQNSGTTSGFNHNIVVANTAAIASSGVVVSWYALGN